MSRRSVQRVLIFIAGVFASFILAGLFLRHTFSALITSVVLAYLMNPGLKHLEKQGLGRLPALAILYLCLFVVALFASFALVPYLQHQIEALPRAVPHYAQNLQQVIEVWKTRFTPYYASEEGEWLAARVTEGLKKLAVDFSGKGYQQVKGALFGLFNLALAPILIFFMLYYKEFFKDVILRLVPHRERHSFREVGGRIKRSLERFIVAQFIDCLLVGMLSAGVLYLLGIEFPLLNGLFAGFASVVPFIGVMVAMIPAAFIGYAETGDLTIIPKVCVAYFFISVVIEGNLIKPLVMRGTLKLNPLAVIFALMALGELLGFWGVVLAVPLTAVVKIFGEEARGYLQEREDGG